MPAASLTQRSRIGSVPPKAELSREFRLLVDIAFDEKANLGHLLPDPALDWNYLMEAARFHGLVPIVAPRLLRQVSSVPERVRLELQEASRRALEGSLTLSGELVRVLRTLNADEIECIPFKGPALAAQLWGNFTLRQSMDIDLLVRPAQVERAVKALQSCGYSPDGNSSWRKLLSSAVELPLKKTGMPILELQWGIVPRCFAVDLEMDACWQRSQSAEFGGQATSAFSPEDLLLILCIHGWKHAWNRLLWLADVARLIRNSPALDWHALWLRAKSCGMENILVLALSLCRKLFGLALPAELEEAVATSPTITGLADESIRYMQGLTQPTYTGWHRYLLLARERPVDRIRHLFRFLFTPGVGDWETIRLPQFVSPFYRMIRLARLSQVAAQYAFRRD